jgi:hypothetical protein
MVKFQCAICLDEIEDSEYVTDCCNQTFHRYCLNNWIKKSEHKNCPYCRENLSFIEKLDVDLNNEIDTIKDLSFIYHNGIHEYQINNILNIPTGYLHKNINIAGKKEDVKIYLYSCEINNITYWVSSILNMMILNSNYNDIVYRKTTNGYYFDCNSYDEHHELISCYKDTLLHLNI